MYYIVLYCIILYCIILYYIVLYYIILCYIILYIMYYILYIHICIIDVWIPYLQNAKSGESRSLDHDLHSYLHIFTVKSSATAAGKPLTHLRIRQDIWQHETLPEKQIESPTCGHSVLGSLGYLGYLGWLGHTGPLHFYFVSRTRVSRSQSLTLQENLDQFQASSGLSGGVRNASTNLRLLELKL